MHKLYGAQGLIAFLKHDTDIHTYKHIHTIQDLMQDQLPHTKALSSYDCRARQCEALNHACVSARVPMCLCMSMYVRHILECNYCRVSQHMCIVLYSDVLYHFTWCKALFSPVELLILFQCAIAYTCLQVAFGTDFVEQLPETNPQLSSCPRGKTFTSLLDLSLYGLNKSTRFPGYQVYNMINVFVVDQIKCYEFMQYYHPFEAALYRRTSRSLRAIGRDCIKRRIQMIENGEKVPNDILTHILQLTCKSQGCMCSQDF